MAMQPTDDALPGPTRRLAAFAASLSYDDIPADVILKIKHLLLDTLGCTLAATTLGAGCREVVQVMQDLGGKPESTILGIGAKVAAPNAALANGALAHALNYDPYGHETGHIGITCLTAPLAMAEAVGGVSGRDFLTAAIVAAEVTSRVTAAQARTGKPASANFMAGQILGYFGAAASAGRLLGLDAEAMHSAFGLALMQSSGTMEVVVGGDPPSKAIYGAFPNHGGLLAALLAKAGLGGQCAALEGKAGFYAMFYHGDYQRDALTEDLGKRFLVLNTQFKPWPTSAIVHPFIEAAGDLHAAGLAPSSIEAVQVLGTDYIRPWVEPLDERRAPRNAASAANSIPFGVAKALLNGDMNLGDFTAEGLRDEAAAAIARRITYAFDDKVEGALVRVSMNDGRTCESHVRVPLGHPSKPVPYERLVTKFRDCCRFVANPLSEDKIDRLILMIETLEDCDLGELVAVASGL